MRYKINIMGGSGAGCPKEKELKKAVRETLRLEGVGDSVELSILLMDDKKIGRLNRRYLNRSGPTDVISFGVAGNGPVIRKLKGYIGDIAISTDTARRNAGLFGTTKKSEILLYAVHGTLHLLGYDDGIKKGKQAMDRKQDKVMERICRGN